MKERILTGWTFTRALYVVMGALVIINSAVNQQRFGVLLGVYFASMGLFRFGCAAGACFGGSCNTELQQKNKTQIKDAEFEEVKTKEHGNFFKNYKFRQTSIG